MTTNIFLNLPVSDLQKSIAFFTKLGFSFNPQFTDDKATCMILNEKAYVMLLVREYFQTFIKKEVVDATKSTEAIIAISVDSREAVDAFANTALESGAAPAVDPQDHGFMYNRSFQDLDGHQWEVFWMDPGAIQG